MPDYIYNPTIAFSLVNSSLTIEDVIREEERENIRYGQDNLVTLVYKEQMLSFQASDFFSIPDQQVQEEVTLNMQMNSFQQDFSQTITLDVGEGVRLDSMALKDGTLLFNAAAQQLQAEGFDLDVEVSLPQSRDEQGIPLSFWVLAGEPEEVDLGGYTFELSSGQNIHNQLQIDYKVVVSGNGTAQQNSYQVQLESNFLDLEFDKVYGYLGNHVMDLGSQLILLDIFSVLQDGSIELAQPSVTLRAINSIGIPIDLSVNPFVAVKQGVGYDITGMSDPVHINSPTADYLLERVNTQEHLTVDNSNIAQVLTRFPEEIIYGLSLEVNPDGNEPNFAFDSSQLDVELEVALPLDGRLSGITLKDTFDIDLQQEVEEIQWVELNLEVHNGFPLDARVQVQLLDVNNLLIMNLFEDQAEENIVTAGQIDEQGRVTAPGISNITLMLDKNQVQQLLNTSRIVLVSRLNTANDGTSMVKILSDNEINIRLGARVNVQSTVSF
ncbi:MAG: hypothetical protein R6U64_10545 [Bacteroidales bacterium]